MKINILALTGIGSCLLASASSHAATSVSYVGFQANVDPKQTSQPATADSFGWRNSTPAKPLDIDGDNIIGTDGYLMRGGTSLPSYISATQNISGGGNNFGYADNPADPTGIDTFRTGFWGVSNTSGAQSFDMFSFTVGGSTLVDQTLRLAVYYDTFSQGTFTYTLTQTVGGSLTATSGTLTMANDGYDFAFFDIVGAASGDKFVISAADVGAVNTTQYHEWGGFAFDTVATVPEPSAVLLGGVGFLMLLRRRR